MSARDTFSLFVSFLFVVRSMQVLMTVLRRRCCLLWRSKRNDNLWQRYGCPVGSVRFVSFSFSFPFRSVFVTDTYLWQTLLKLGTQRRSTRQENSIVSDVEL